MFAADSLVIDLIFGAGVAPTPEAIIEGLGGEDVARARLLVDADLDVPQYEMVAPSVPLRRQDELRLLVVDESVAPLRKNPRADPIVARDLRPERERLCRLVERTGARLGRLYAFGTWGDAAVVTRSMRDLRGHFLLGWVLDPAVDLDGRRRANPLSRPEIEEKVATYPKRLDELDDDAVLARVPPAHHEARGALHVVDVLSDRDGSWDIRSSYQLEARVAAADRFSRIPGARQAPAPAAEPEPGPTPAAAAPPPPAPEPPRSAGPPLHALEVEGRVVLRIPAERFSLDLTTALGKRSLDLIGPGDVVPGRLRDRIHEAGCGFVAPLAFLSEVFLEGRPLDRRRFDAEAVEIAPGARALEAHLPRFGPVRVVDVGGRRWVTSEVGLAPDRLLPLLLG